MANAYFHFKQFSIFQDRCAMKVGTDGVLLGAWVDTENTVRILDIGTGTGLIALMLAQRSDAHIDAVEINEEAFLQALENVERSKWKSRINVFHNSFQSFIVNCNKYDLIVTNPPYFKNSLLSGLKSRSVARHNITLSALDLVEGIKEILYDKGKFAIILPRTEHSAFCELMRNNKFYESRRMSVMPVPGSLPKRILSEFTRIKKTPQCSQLVIEKYGRHKYSEEYTELTKDFYLKM